MKRAKRVKSVGRETRLPFYGPGLQKTRAGHLRYTSPSRLRGQYQHRKVVEDNLAATSFYVLQLLPWPYEVHHPDWDKTHNEGHNLLMLSTQFHAKLTCNQRRVDGKFAGYNPKHRPPPDWVLFKDEDEGIPF